MWLDGFKYTESNKINIRDVDWNIRSTVNDTMFMVVAGITFMFVAVTIYYAPMLSRFDKSTMNLLKMSAISAFRYLPITIGCFAVIIVMLVGIWLMPWMLVVVPGLFMFLFTFPCEFIMKRFMEKPDGDSEEKWYYKI